MLDLMCSTSLRWELSYNPMSGLRVYDTLGHTPLYILQLQETFGLNFTSVAVKVKNELVPNKSVGFDVSQSRVGLGASTETQSLTPEQ